MNIDQTRQIAGFTLVEVLVAIAITAIVAVMAYGSLNAAMQAGQQTQREAQRLTELQTAFTIIGRDLRQAVPRAIRDEFESNEPAMFGGDGAPMPLIFTRGGWRNPLNRQRSTLQRVGYLVEDDQLFRLSWSILDRVQNVDPVRTLLLTQIVELRIRFLSVDDQNTQTGNASKNSSRKRKLDIEGLWQDSWQAAFVNNSSSNLPVAVEFFVELEDWGEIIRVFDIASA